MFFSFFQRIDIYKRDLGARVANSLFPFGVISLSVGEKLKLPLAWLPTKVWKIEGINIKLNGGYLYTERDQVGKLSRGNLYFLNKVKIPVTIVPWKVDRKALSFIESKGKYTVLGNFKEKVYFTDEKNLYVTRDNFKSKEKITKLPWKQTYRSDRSLLLKTPVGWFLRTDGGVIHSTDLREWKVAIELGSRGMFQHLAYSQDEVDGVTYVFATEYTTEPGRKHSIYKGVYTCKTCLGWEKVYEFYSSNEGRASQQNRPAARHIHVLTIDKNNWLWVATGDSDSESGIFVSTDFGKTFRIFAAGSQQYRTLMLQFTKDYLYWNMDTHLQDQKVFRYKLNDLTESAVKKLPDAASVSFSTEKAITPPGIEQVATLPYGAQWYGVLVTNPLGEKVLLMSASPESQVPETGEQPHRDWNARIFSIRQLDSKLPAVSEVASIPPVKNLKGKARRYCRVDPRCQDDKGFIYFMSHNSVIHGAISGVLNY